MRIIRRVQLPGEVHMLFALSAEFTVALESLTFSLVARPAGRGGLH